MQQPTHLTGRAFARAIGRSFTTVCAWVRAGRLPDVETTPGGYYVIPARLVGLVKIGVYPLPHSRERVGRVAV